MVERKKCIVCDIDGTLVDTDFIFKEISELNLKGEERWDYFHEHCNSDRVKPLERATHFIELINFSVFMSLNIIPNESGKDELKVADTGGYDIILSTARKELSRKGTVQKLKELAIPFDKLYMRADDDKRLASEIKRDHLLEIKKEYDIIAFIDDDLTNCNMAKELGLFALRVV
jgi:FMN phosphatase YigB (HAD superfamily)